MPYPMPMGFPHLVVEKPGVNERWEITVTNERVAELERPARLGRVGIPKLVWM